MSEPFFNVDKEAVIKNDGGPNWISIETANARVAPLQQENERLKARVEDLEEALEYYSDVSTYQCVEHGSLHETDPKTARNFNHIPVYALDNKGGIARMALKARAALEGEKE